MNRIKASSRLGEGFDLVIVGGGILGTSLAYWASLLYEGKIAVLEAEEDVALHASGRNTGVIHRPFYLDPKKKRIFASCAQLSFPLWKKFAQIKNLPWKEVGTLEVATTEKELQILEKYLYWAKENGMKEEELELLSASQVRKLESHVHCAGAVHVKTDTSVDFKAMTGALKQDAMVHGVRFIFNFEADRIELQQETVQVLPAGRDQILEAKFLINCAGGNAVDLAHQFGAGLEFTDLHFRGEYWEILPERANLARRNIYSVPRHSEIPFLDPHWILRADGRSEIGPNAVLVAGCQTYEGFCNSWNELIKKMIEPPIKNKIRLLFNPEFLGLALSEWKSSFSKREMVRRVQRFLPELSVSDLSKRGTPGIRSSVIDSKGNFVKEAIEISAPLSYHILNYNSPGATGAPAYTAYILSKLVQNGYLEKMKKREIALPGIWNFEQAIEGL